MSGHAIESVVSDQGREFNTAITPRTNRRTALSPALSERGGRTGSMFGVNAWLRFRLIGLVVCILVAGFVATNLMSYRDAVEALKTTILHDELPLTGTNIYSEVQADLIRPVFIASQMANDTFVKDWLLAGEQDSARAVRYLDAIREKYAVFTSFLISDKTRNYYHFSGKFRQVDEANPDDLWFFRVKNMTAPYEINIDFDQASNRTVTIFVNYRALDYDGRFIGVTGVGLNVDTVQGIVERYRSAFNRNVYFINKSGDVTITPAVALAATQRSGDNIKALAGISAIATQILASPGGEYEYQRGGENYLLETRFIPELGWYVLVEQRQAEATRPLWASFMTNLWVGLGITLVTAAMIGYAVEIYHRRMNVMATTDKLTGVANRQAFDELLEQFVRSRRPGLRPFSLLLFDIDHFKQINDTLGHLRGDAVIRRVADMAVGVLRDTDMICRWGGEELIVLARNCPLADAVRLAESLCATIAAEPILQPDDGTRVTISVGVTDHRPGETVDAILSRVDQALYQAKRAGRNCVRVAEPTMSHDEIEAAQV
jgi:diguanylate cyclase (GGDEF)-like protein